MKERSGCRSLLPALTRSPVSAACPMQTCFTSIADATENCKERSCFSFLTRASMKLIFILGTSGTRWPAFLSIKVWHYAANLAVSLSKGLLFPPDLSLTLFWHVNMSSWLSAWCHAMTQAAPLIWHIKADTLTGDVKTAFVTSKAWQHIFRCLSGWKLSDFWLYTTLYLTDRE